MSSVIGNWMKNNRTCWSVAGANNLAALLTLHRTGYLRRVLRDWTAQCGTESYLLAVTEPMSAAQSARRTEDVYIPPHTLSAGEIHPATKYCLTSFVPLSGMHTYDRQRWLRAFPDEFYFEQHLLLAALEVPALLPTILLHTMFKNVLQ